MKTCNTCKTMKDFVDYDLSNRSKDGYRNKCKQCETATVETEAIKNVTKVAEKQVKERIIVKAKIIDEFTGECKDCGRYIKKGVYCTRCQKLH